MRSPTGYAPPGAGSAPDGGAPDGTPAPAPSSSSSPELSSAVSGVPGPRRPGPLKMALRSRGLARRAAPCLPRRSGSWARGWGGVSNCGAGSSSPGQGGGAGGPSREAEASA